MKINRREFLFASGLAFLSRPQFVFGQTKKHIIVAGAGLSGLSAAYELSNLGYKVTVIEGRNRVGGRISTLRNFDDGMYVELGGELIGNGYKRMLSYADKFGLKYKDVANEVETGGSVTNLQGGIGTAAIMKGKFYSAGSVLNPHPYNLQGDEANALPPTLLTRFTRAMLKDLRDGTKTLADFDKLSLADVLREKKVSEEAIKLINIAINYNSIETVSAGGFLFEMQRRQSAGTKAFKLIGGNDQIPNALAENSTKNGVKIILEAKVKQINQADGKVSVVFVNKKGQEETVSGDKLVCTIPFSVLRDVKFSPALPEAKANAINNVTYTKVAKIYLQENRLEWDRRNIGSSIWTDTNCERIFSLVGKNTDKRGIFAIWTEGDGSDFLSSMNDKQRIIWGKREFERNLTFMRRKFERGDTKSWTNDEFVKGSYAHFLRGQFTTIQPNMASQVGLIHFAGEHTAQNAPGMEGALESAERVVKEINGN
jgi:monoamine oxidase